MARGRKSPKLANDESSFDIDRNKVETAGFATVDKRIDGLVDSSADQTFIVKMIRNHKIDKAGNVRFLVEWLGYESKKDWTWEPESNLSISGDQILNEYYATIGGRDVIFKKPGRIPRAKRARQRGTKMMTPNYTSTEQWRPPAGSWEEHIKRIDYCEEEEEKLVVYLVWKNGKKTKHGAQVIYEKCPQMMLKYYEDHIKIIGKGEGVSQKPTSSI